MNVFFGFIVEFCYSLLGVVYMILVARYTLVNGIKTGLVSGLGYCLAQLIWAMLGILFLGMVGPHFVSNKIMNSTYYMIPGILIIIFIAYKVYTAPLPVLGEKFNKNYFGAFSTIFFLAILKPPMRLMGYAGLFVLCGIHISISYWDTWMPLIIGVMLGVLFYWCFFVYLVSKSRDKVTPEGLQKFSKVGAFVMVCLCLASILIFL